MTKGGFVYILSNDRNTVLYVGVTSDLQKRVYEHKAHLVAGFSDKYNVTKLVYYECFSSIEDAIAREKQLKGWSRAKKDALIDSMNQARVELFDALV